MQLSNDNNLLEYLKEISKPIHHTPVNLGIKKFKRELRILFPHLTRHRRYMLVQAYKKRGWMDYNAVIRERGSFPTHPVYGSKVKITTASMDVEYEVNVNGKQK